MAHLWVKDGAAQWAVLPLNEDAFTLSTNPPGPVVTQFGGGDSLADVLLVRARTGTDAWWVLIARSGSGATVNGIPIGTGIRVLSDRDQIRVPSANDVYFSSESLASAEEFPGLDQVSFCPRCKQEIDRSARAVKCPSCGVWHHQTDELNCWTYADVCALCTQPTNLDAGFRWTPEDEEL